MSSQSEWIFSHMLPLLLQEAEHEFVLHEIDESLDSRFKHQEIGSRSDKRRKIREYEE